MTEEEWAARARRARRTPSRSGGVLPGSWRRLTGVRDGMRWYGEWMVRLLTARCWEFQARTGRERTRERSGTSPFRAQRRCARPPLAGWQGVQRSLPSSPGRATRRPCCPLTAGRACRPARAQNRVFRRASASCRCPPSRTRSSRGSATVVDRRRRTTWSCWPSCDSSQSRRTRANVGWAGTWAGRTQCDLAQTQVDSEARTARRGGLTARERGDAGARMETARAAGARSGWRRRGRAASTSAAKRS